VPLETAADDIVHTHAQAAGNARAALLVLEPLTAYLDERGLGAGEIRATPIGDGHSNVTYLIEREDGAELVLRRPPRPPLPPSAHDVLREARLLQALRDTPVRAPAVLAMCAQEELIGSPFYLMERVSGEVITATVPPALDTPGERARVAEELVDALVEIHGVDWRAAGLEDFGRPTGYLQRQIRRFSGLWETNRTRELPSVERLGRWLAESLPTSTPAATIVHGDYRLGNTMFAPSAPASLVAVLDWEMATIGDPLADLGYLCMMWTEAADPHMGVRESLGGVTRDEGFPSRAELIALYEERSGRPMHDIRWYTVLALWRMLIFMEGNYRRALLGASDDPFLRSFGESVVELADEAESLAFRP
jgi:aminoglycoside phosphotransferase (APT) family kinase protein